MIANYCPACNERFPKKSDDVADNHCPQCGARLQAAPTRREFDETLDLAGPVQTHVAGQSSTPRDLDFLVGSDLGVYHIESLLGRGGMGHVFVAQHRQLQRHCALKLLSPRARHDHDYVERFQHEGRTAASLVHPNVTIIHAIGEESGLHFLEMEMLTGGTLQQLVGREGKVSPPKAAELMIQACAGMAAAHDQGMIHRDLKPDNILLTDAHHPKIADFGLAKRVASDGGDTVLAGTPNYMAPELFAGGAPSTASDVYALGATFFTLLTGEVPFAAENLAALIKHVKNSELPDVAQFGVTAPSIVNEVLSQLLEKSPQARCRDAGAAMRLLSRVVNQVRDLGAMTKEALGSMSHVELDECEPGSDCQPLTVRMSNGRSQRVVLERVVPPDGVDHLLLIYSVCCEANADFYEKALRLNGRMAHGGMAIRELQGVPMFCVVDTYPWATVDADEIRLSTVEVAKHADEVERELTGRDLR